MCVCVRANLWLVFPHYIYILSQPSKLMLSTKPSYLRVTRSHAFKIIKLQKKKKRKKNLKVKHSLTYQIKRAYDRQLTTSSSGSDS